MSVTANDKGAVEQRINLVKRGKGQLQHCMLNTVLIKKPENYGLRTDHFVINNLPPILQTDNVLVTIMPRRAQNAVIDDFDMGGAAPDEAYLGARSDFPVGIISEVPGEKIYSVARLCEALASFMRDFNLALNMQGADYSPPVFNLNPLYVVPEHNLLTFVDMPFDLGNYVGEHEIQTHVGVGFNTNGQIQLTMTSQFLSNFYIEFDPVFAKLVGLPTTLYAHDDQAGGVTLSSQVGIPALFNQAGTHFALDSRIDLTAPGDIYFPTVVQSTRSIFNVDDRLSLDVEVTLPLSQTIDVHDGSEKHTYVLSRFMVTDYIHIESRTQQRGGQILTKNIISDELGTGFTDLVKDRPGAHTTQLLNGKIQALDVRLVLRYKKFAITNDTLGFTVGRKIFELDDDGVYDLLLAFNKKV